MENFLYIILAVIGLFIALQLFLRLSAYFKKGKEIKGISGSLGREISSGRKLAVYFFSNSCAACKPMTPVVEKLQKEFPNLHKINLASDMDTGRKFGVMGTPCTVVVEKGMILNFILGARTEPFLRSIINS
jgi:thioredoxin 1